MHHRARQVLPPLPGTGTPPRGLFVSRWGALLQRPSDGFPRRFEDARFHTRVLEILFRASQAGWRLYVIGNEDDVARGRVADSHWERFHASLMEHIHKNGITLTRDYACTDHPEGKPPHDKESVFLFPNTGALYHAAQQDGIELSESWLVSDDVLQQAAAWRAGVRVAAVRPLGALREGELHVEPDLIARGPAESILEVLAVAPSVRP
jgi:D-glycero-D-manno-heptose 1,7-bisphosphate phosphatase